VFQILTTVLINTHFILPASLVKYQRNSHLEFSQPQSQICVLTKQHLSYLDSYQFWKH